MVWADSGCGRSSSPGAPEQVVHGPDDAHQRARPALCPRCLGEPGRREGLVRMRRHSPQGRRRAAAPRERRWLGLGPPGLVHRARLGSSALPGALRTGGAAPRRSIIAPGCKEDQYDHTPFGPRGARGRGEPHGGAESTMDDGMKDAHPRDGGVLVPDRPLLCDPIGKVFDEPS